MLGKLVLFLHNFYFVRFARSLLLPIRIVIAACFRWSMRVILYILYWNWYTYKSYHLPYVFKKVQVRTKKVETSQHQKRSTSFSLMKLSSSCEENPTLLYIQLHVAFHWRIPRAVLGLQFSWSLRHLCSNVWSKKLNNIWMVGFSSTPPE